MNQLLEINRHGKKGKEIWVTEGKVELQCNSGKILTTSLGSLEYRQSKLSILEYIDIIVPQWLGLYTSTWPVIGCRLSWTACVLEQGNCLQLGLTLKGLTEQQAFPWRGIIVAHVHIHYILCATQIHFFKYIQIDLESCSSRILMYLSSQKKLKRKKSVGQIIAPSSRVGLKTITDTYCLSPLKKFWITSISALLLLMVVTYLMELQALIPEKYEVLDIMFSWGQSCWHVPLSSQLTIGIEKKALRCIYYVDIMRSYCCPHLVKALLLPPDNQGPGSWPSPCQAGNSSPFLPVPGHKGPWSA